MCICVIILILRTLTIMRIILMITVIWKLQQIHWQLTVVAQQSAGSSEYASVHSLGRHSVLRHIAKPFQATPRAPSNNHAKVQKQLHGCLH